MLVQFKFPNICLCKSSENYEIEMKNKTLKTKHNLKKDKIKYPFFDQGVTCPSSEPKQMFSDWAIPFE